LPLAATALLVAVAGALLRRRDFGAGLVASRPGRAEAAPALRNAYALSWRLQRGSLLGWAVGLGLLGVAYGSIGDSIEQYIEDNPEIAEFLTGGGADIVNGYLALTTALSALIVAAYGVASALRLRADETAGLAEPVLATATSRLTWLAGHLSVTLVGSALVLLAFGLGQGAAYGVTVSDAGQVLRMAGVALAYLPAVWLIIAVVVLAFGWLPRPAAVLGWVTVGYCAVVTLFGDSFDLPGWSQRASPFAHTPQVPLADLTFVPLIVIGLLAAAALAAGYAGLRRRDVGY
jgi:ABC-2 type transport system permease protein